MAPLRRKALDITDQRLVIDYVGEIYRLEPGETLEFGRSAQLTIDDNRYLHRRLGRFEHRDNLWMLCNIGRSLHLTVLDTQSQSQAVVAPGREIALTFAPALVRFGAGRTTYELIITNAGAISPVVNPSDETYDTVTFSHFPLTATQRLLVISLAEPTLRHPAAGIQVPTSREAAVRLNWTITQFNRKLDNVCAKLTKVGVAGLHGTSSSLATNRRQVLVEFAVESGLVTEDDLSLIDQCRAG